ncbi:SMP-30/gluconolactonase/LRE family protein [Glutamicibacter sp. Je.9.36]|uniref:SMP-30/gluconolactonase/LRE family protein n=1 Tax=Glutamicibacter sp. Je.9.36 TaxID=3142837 RepID=UPI003DA8336A
MSRRIPALGLAGLGLMLALTGCGQEAPVSEGVAQHAATELLQVTQVHAETGMTLLEGPVLDGQGNLFVVDVPAPAGEAKLLKIDLNSKDVSQVHTDGTGAYSSAQFSPADQRMYLSDIAGGRIISMNADGSDVQVFFEGDVDGRRVSPDDIAFDKEGNLFVSDFTAFPGAGVDAAQAGRIIRIDGETAQGSVVAENLPSTNGISFNEDYSGLWLSQYAANRIDLLALDQTGMKAASVQPAIYVNAGVAKVDSNAVDAAGNIYQMFEHDARIDVYSKTGQLKAQIRLPDDAQGLESATNIAIEPGTTQGYATVSGKSGGYVYTFEALAEGISQSNGG